MSSLLACINSTTGYLTGLRATVAKTNLDQTLNGTQTLYPFGATTGTSITCSTLNLDHKVNESISLINVTYDKDSLRYISVLTSENKTFSKGKYDPKTQIN